MGHCKVWSVQFAQWRHHKYGRRIQHSIEAVPQMERSTTGYTSSLSARVANLISQQDPESHVRNEPVSSDERIPPP